MGLSTYYIDLNVLKWHGSAREGPEGGDVIERYRPLHAKKEHEMDMIESKDWVLGGN